MNAFIDTCTYMHVSKNWFWTVCANTDMHASVHAYMYNTCTLALYVWTILVISNIIAVLANCFSSKQDKYFYALKM